MNIQEYADKYASFFEEINEDTALCHYENVFDENVYFQDPFQKVRGLTKVYTIFQHMYKTLYEPSFLIDEIVCDKNCAYLHWNFSYKRSKNHQSEKFTGVSRILFLDNGKAISHIDYWDAAENIYEKVPLLGAMIRVIKKRIRA